MNRFRVQATAATMLAGLWTMGAPAEAATAVHKCSENGVVTFQNMPCRPDEPGARPTAAQLNAERQKKLRQQAGAASSAQRQAPVAAPVAASQARPRR